MSELTILIADDEPLAARRLRVLIERRPDLRLVGTARDGEEAIEAIRALRPDVLLLDVQMPGLDGFEVVERLAGTFPPAVIFVTAFDHHAPRAFEARALDYLVKPVEAQRLYDALDHARERRDQMEARSQIEELREIIANLRRGGAPAAPAPRFESEFWVKSLGETVRVPVEEIERIEAERDYVRLHTAGRSFLHREPLGDIEKRLDPQAFLRVHRSTIVRRDCVAAIGKSASRTPVLRLASGEQVSVGRSYADRLQKLRG
ncbi:MAG: response regulator transcription factor [Sphingomonadales bacterium]|nr:response regulator transcription factor [Sphingomonadales bacterium]